MISKRFIVFLVVTVSAFGLVLMVVTLAGVSVHGAFALGFAFSIPIELFRDRLQANTESEGEVPRVLLEYEDSINDKDIRVVCVPAVEEPTTMDEYKIETQIHEGYGWETTATNWTVEKPEVNCPW